MDRGVVGFQPQPRKLWCATPVIRLYPGLYLSYTLVIPRSEGYTWIFPHSSPQSHCHLHRVHHSVCPQHHHHVTVFYSQQQHHQHLTSLSSHCCFQMKSTRASLCWDTKARTFLERSTKIFISDSQIRPQCLASPAAISHISKSSYPQKMWAWSLQLIFRHTIASEWVLTSKGAHL